MNPELFKTFAGYRVLVIDDMSQMRAVLREQLASIGIKTTSQAANAEEALALLKKEKFDVVLADYNLGTGLNGQQLLDKARELDVLPQGTAWLMVTAENGREMVSVAAEHAPDDYIIKPITAAVLMTRIVRSLQRRAALKPFFTALDDGDHDRALTLAAQLAASGGVYALEGAKQQGKLMMTVGDFEGAKKVYRDILERRSDTPFAALGLARALKANGEVAEAQVVALELKDQYPELVGAYDLLLEIHEETNDLERAFQVAKAAAKVVPSAKRHMKVGRTALAVGDTETALKAFERASLKQVGPAATSLSDLCVLLQAYVTSGEHRKALDVCAAQAPQFKRDQVAELVFNAIRAQALKGLRSHIEGQKHYDLVKELLDSVTLDDNGKLTVLAAAVAFGDHRTMESLVTELARNNHDDAVFLGQVKGCAAGTLMASRVDELVGVQVKLLQARVAEVKSAAANQDYPGALAAADRALSQAAGSCALLEAKAEALCQGLASPAHATSLYLTAVEFALALEQKHASRRNASRLAKMVKGAMAKVKR